MIAVTERIHRVHEKDFDVLWKLREKGHWRRCGKWICGSKKVIQNKKAKQNCVLNLTHAWSTFQKLLSLEWPFVDNSEEIELVMWKIQKWLIILCYSPF